MLWFSLFVGVFSLVWSECIIVPDEIEETWGYVDVRPKAHQFWWFMKTPCDGADQKPIIIWLQGGPGGSGTGYGNFMEIGRWNLSIKGAGGVRGRFSLFCCF